MGFDHSRNYYRTRNRWQFNFTFTCILRRKLNFQQGKQFVFVAIIALKVNARDAKTVDSIKITIYTKHNREKELSNSQNCEIFNLTDGHIIWLMSNDSSVRNPLHFVLRLLNKLLILSLTAWHLKRSISMKSFLVLQTRCKWKLLF